MHHKIQISFQLATNTREIVRIPIVYKIIEDTEKCTKTVYCRVDLPPECIPKWLSPTSFEMVNHYKSGMHVVHYKAGELRTLMRSSFGINSTRK